MPLPVAGLPDKEGSVMPWLQKRFGDALIRKLIMNLNEHPKFDPPGMYTLHENHLMAFLHMDGFTERLLDFKLFITKSLSAEVYISSFKKKSVTGEHVIKDIPAEIISFLETVAQAGEVDFGYTKINSAFLEDAPAQDYLFAHDGNTIRFSINGGMILAEKDFTTEPGKQFCRLTKFVNGWMEELYDRFVDGNDGY